jgi:hypothetical protein
MYSKIILTFLLIPVFMMSSCKTSQIDGQGIQGKITWLEGNQMPTMTEDGKSSEVNPKGIPAERLLLIYPLTNLSEVAREGALFSRLKGEPIDSVQSDSDGKYSIQLAPGTYSVFVKEEEGLFANMFDGNGSIQPVVVKNAEWTTLDIIINYKAFF